MTPAFATLPYASRRLSGAGLGIVLLAHAAAFWLLLAQRDGVLATPPVVLTVSLLPESPRAVPEPPRPQPRPTPVPTLTKPVAAPTPLPVETRPAPAASAAATPSPAATAATAPPAPTTAPAPAAPAPAVISQPRFDADYLDNPKPAYPPLSRRLGEQGRVVLRVHVDARGLPSEVLLHTGSGFERLDQSALNTVRRWKFVPAKRGTEAVAEWVLVPVAFTLN